MAKKNDITMKLPSVDDLFTVQEEREDTSREKIIDIQIADISEFPNHPFKVRADEAMMDMVDSVRQYGVLVPAIVRPKDDGSFEMIAGHRRRKASELAGNETLPCIVRDMTDDEATLIMVDSNLQRETILPSEKAFAYKMKLEALKRQGQRSDLTSVPMEPKWRSNEELAKKSEDSVSQIKRYIRLTELIPPILDMVDEGRIAFRPAVELSYLTQEEQESLFDTMDMEDATPSLAQAIKMKKFSQENKLNEDVICAILQEEKPNQVEQFKIPKKKLEKYFPNGTSTKTMEDTIVKALDMYLKRQKNRDMER